MWDSGGETAIVTGGICGTRRALASPLHSPLMYIMC